MAQDLFSSVDCLDSFVFAPAVDAALMIRDVTRDYRLADADEVLVAGQRLLARRMHVLDILNAPGVVKDFRRARLAKWPHRVFAVIHLYRNFGCSTMWRCFAEPSRRRLCDHGHPPSSFLTALRLGSVPKIELAKLTLRIVWLKANLVRYADAHEGPIPLNGRGPDAGPLMPGVTRVLHNRGVFLTN